MERKLVSVIRLDYRSMIHLIVFLSPLIQIDSCGTVVKWIVFHVINGNFRHRR
ncbi:MAG: hypothetical protein ACOYD6_02280 [Limnochordia bacterium]